MKKGTAFTDISKKERVLSAGGRLPTAAERTIQMVLIPDGNAH